MRPTARLYRGGVPAPPKNLADEMADAGKADDQARLGLLQDRYEDWLETQGYPRKHQGRPPRADRAAQ